MREGFVTDVATELDQQVVRVAERLVADYAGKVSDDEVRRLVGDAMRRLGDARITQFLPVLVDRSVRDALRDVSRL